MPPLAQNPKRILTKIRDSLTGNSRTTTHDNFLWRLDGYAQFLRLNQCDDALQEFLRNNDKLFDLHICIEQAINQICATTIIHYSINRVRAFPFFLGFLLSEYLVGGTWVVIGAAFGIEVYSFYR